MPTDAEYQALAKLTKELANEIKCQEADISRLEQSFKRLERQVEVMERELGELKKDALTEADIKPFKKLLK